MPVFSGSRFEGLSFTPIILSDGTSRRFLHLRIPGAGSGSRVQHELLPTEEFDFLAFRFSGQARNWWKIAEANDLFWPLGLPQGTRLDIPF